MRNRAIFDHSAEEISWTFNDFLLGFLMIVLMMASLFAFLSNSVVVDSFIDQCEDPDDPNCGIGTALFGGRQKGDSSDKLVEKPSGDTAPDFVKKWAGIGDVSGNSEVKFGSPELNPQKVNIVFEILPTGDILYRGEIVSLEDMQKLINAVALEKGVFLEAIVHSGTPFEVYKVTRNQLWDLADAEHWRDVVQTDENQEGIKEAVSRFGTTYLEGAETEDLRTAPRRGGDNEALFDNNFDAFQEVDSGLVQEVLETSPQFESSAFEE